VGDGGDGGGGGGEVASGTNKVEWAKQQCFNEPFLRNCF
jgi:hypothetical protein